MATDFDSALQVRNSTQAGEELKVVITDPAGAHQAKVLNASTAAAAGDKALVVAISPNNTVPVSGTFWPATQAVSGTVTADQGSPNTLANAWPSKITDGTTAAHVTPASTAAVASDPALVVAISPNNVLNVNLASSNPTGAVTIHRETASAAASTAKFEEFLPASWPFYVDSVWSSASGKHKLEIWTNIAGQDLVAGATNIRTGGTPTQLLTGFSSAANLNIDKDFSGNAAVAASLSVYAILTNTDNQPQSMYVTLAGNS